MPPKGKKRGRNSKKKGGGGGAKGGGGGGGPPKAKRQKNEVTKSAEEVYDYLLKWSKKDEVGRAAPSAAFELELELGNSHAHEPSSNDSATSLTRTPTHAPYIIRCTRTSTTPTPLQ